MGHEKSLLDTISERLQAEDFELPVYSPIAARVQTLASNPNTELEQLEKVLLHDATLSAEILRLANSSFFAGLNKIETVRAAITRLGFQQIVSLAVVCAQREQFRSGDRELAGWIGQLWRHSLACAVAGKWIAERCGYRERASEVFLAGLFHDIGKLVLFKAIEDCRARQLIQAGLPNALLLEIVGALHAEQGALLLERWQLPPLYVDIARQHAAPEPDELNPIGLMVRLANLTCLKLGLDLRHEPSILLASTPEAAALGIKEVALAELEIMLEDGVMKLAV
jgi:putative nucleotidyltransferase with HDIG domain